MHLQTDIHFVVQRITVRIMYSYFPCFNPWNVSKRSLRMSSRRQETLQVATLSKNDEMMKMWYISTYVFRSLQRLVP